MVLLERIELSTSPLPRARPMLNCRMLSIRYGPPHHAACQFCACALDAQHFGRAPEALLPIR